LKPGAAGEIELSTSSKFALRKDKISVENTIVLKDAPLAKDDGRPVMDQLRDALIANSKRVIDLFRSWDDDYSGTVSKAEFRRGLLELGYSAPKRAIEELFDQMDTDRSGTLSYDELNRTLKPVRDAGLDKKLKAGGAGDIELKKEQKVALRKAKVSRADRVLLQGLQLEVGGERSVLEQLREGLVEHMVRVIDLFRQWDDDHTGTVDKIEFRRGLQELGLKAPKDVIDSIFDEIDVDGGGTLEYAELNKKLRPAVDPNKRYEMNPFRFAGPILPQRRIAEHGRVDDYDRGTSLAVGSRWCVAEENMREGETERSRRRADDEQRRKMEELFISHQMRIVQEIRAQNSAASVRVAAVCEAKAAAAAEMRAQRKADAEERAKNHQAFLRAISSRLKQHGPRERARRLEASRQALARQKARDVAEIKLQERELNDFLELKRAQEKLEIQRIADAEKERSRSFNEIAISASRPWLEEKKQAASEVRQTNSARASLHLQLKGAFELEAARHAKELSKHSKQKTRYASDRLLSARKRSARERREERDASLHRSLDSARGRANIKKALRDEIFSSRHVTQDFAKEIQQSPLGSFATAMVSSRARSKSANPMLSSRGPRGASDAADDSGGSGAHSDGPASWRATQGGSRLSEGPASSRSSSRPTTPKSPLRRKEGSVLGSPSSWVRGATGSRSARKEVHI